MTSYVLPYIVKNDMHGWMAYIEYNEDNLVVRFVFMASAAIVSVFILYKLLFN